MKFNKIFFRVDGSLNIGGGHVFRCLAFADYLKKKKVKSYFLIRNLKGNFENEIIKRNHKVYKLKKIEKEKLIRPKKKKFFYYKNSLQLPEKVDAKESLKYFRKINPDIVMVDHYGISNIWHDEIRKFFKLAIIDDLADRKYNCNILIDSTLNRKKVEYKKLVNHDCKLLVGINKAFINDKFLQIKKKSILKNLNNSNIKKILVTMGNSDPLNSTLFIARSLMKFFFENIEFNFLLGRNYKFKKKLKFYLRKTKNKFIILNFTNEMPQLSSKVDFVITSPSVSLLEFLSMGIPCGVIINSKNQEQIAKSLTEKKIIINFGPRNKLTDYFFLKKLKKIIKKKEERRKLIKRSIKLFNANGKQEVYDTIKRFLNKKNLQ